MKHWDSNEIKKSIRAQLQTYLDQAGMGDDDIGDDDDLYAKGVLDSYGTVEILTAIEEETGIQANLATVPEQADVAMVLSVNRLARAFVQP